MILLYHKIDLESPTVWWVNANAFYRQMEALRSYKVVLLDDYDPADPKQAVITFDGIYEDVYNYALPIMRHFGYRFELFIVGDTVGKDNAFDQHVEPAAMFASAEQLTEMVKAGGRLQWHSRSHPDLTLPENASLIDAELDVPEELRKLDPDGFKWFGYPHGKHNNELLRRTEEKFAGGLSCDAGNDHDPYQLNRIIVTNSTNLAPSTVSLIIANYNYAAFAAEAIESVLKQIVPPDEILFIDDCSVDGSLEVAKRYKDSIRIEANEQNLGIVGNFNKAISMTSGDYICFLGADNRFRSDYVLQCRRALDQDENLAIAYTNVVLFGPRAEVVAQQAKATPIPNHAGLFHWDFPAWDRRLVDGLQKSNFIHGSSMYRRSVYEEIGGYIKTDGPEDHNLFARMVLTGRDAVLVPEYLLEYRQHSNEQANITLNTEMEVAHYRRMLRKQNENLTQMRELAAGPVAKQQLLAKSLDLLKQASEAGTLEAGEVLADRVFGQFGEHANLLTFAGQILADRGELSSATSYFEVALRYNEKFAPAHNAMGRALLKLGQSSAAMTHLQRAAQLEPDNARYRDDLAQLQQAGNLTIS